jgi:hypothetical protein
MVALSVVDWSFVDWSFVDGDERGWRKGGVFRHGMGVIRRWRQPTRRVLTVLNLLQASAVEPGWTESVYRRSFAGSAP